MTEARAMFDKVFTKTGNIKTYDKVSGTGTVLVALIEGWRTLPFRGLLHGFLPGSPEAFAVGKRVEITLSNPGYGKQHDVLCVELEDGH